MLVYRKVGSCAILTYTGVSTKNGGTAVASGNEEEDSDDSMVGASPLLQRYEGKALTIKQVAYILNVSSKTVIGWVDKGLLEVVPLPQRGKRRLIRIRGRSVDKWLHPEEKD